MIYDYYKLRLNVRLIKNVTKQNKLKIKNRSYRTIHKTY